MTNLTVDLTRSIPPLPTILAARLSRTLGDVAADPDLGGAMRSARPGGSEADRAAGAAWIRPRFAEPPAPDRVAVTNGTQNALFLLFEGLVGRDGLLLAETLSYGVLRDLAARAHVRLQGLAIDDDGIIPEAFETACRTGRPGALYCNPTDQNPTTAVMSAARRRAIAEIALRYRVPIIEDDALGLLHADAPPALSSLVPGLGWYVMGLTKCLFHGLRVAYLAGPSTAEMNRVIGPALRLSHWFPAPLAAAVATRWVADGTADEILAAIRREATIRRDLAVEILAGADLRASPGSMHLWLRLPPALDRHGLAEDLRRAGVLVRPAELFAVDDTLPPNAVRLSLSSPLARADLERGLRIVAAALGL